MLLDVARGHQKISGRSFRASLTAAETFGCNALYLRHHQLGDRQTRRLY
jgi:hypothetical protein